MSGFSGKRGSVKNSTTGAHLAEVLGWDFDPKTAVPKWASNTTSGVKTGVAGVGDSSGKIEVKMDGTIPVNFRPGNQVILELHADNSGNNYIKVTAIMENVPISSKIDPDGEPVSITYNFQGITNPVMYGLFAASGSSSQYAFTD